MAWWGKVPGEDSGPSNPYRSPGKVKQEDSPLELAMEALKAARKAEAEAETAYEQTCTDDRKGCPACQELRMKRSAATEAKDKAGLVRYKAERALLELSRE